MSKYFLKVKIKSLTAESIIIKAQEKKVKQPVRDQLHTHRVVDVRQEQRATLIAYAYIRGQPYRKCEKLSKGFPAHLAAKIAYMIRKYGPGPISADEITQWGSK